VIKSLSHLLRRRRVWNVVRGAWGAHGNCLQVHAEQARLCRGMQGPADRFTQFKAPLAVCRLPSTALLGDPKGMRDAAEHRGSCSNSSPILATCIKLCGIQQCLPESRPRLGQVLLVAGQRTGQGRARQPPGEQEPKLCKHRCTQGCQQAASA